MTTAELKTLKARTSSRNVKRALANLAKAERHAARYFKRLDSIACHLRVAETYHDFYRAGFSELTGGQQAELNAILGPSIAEHFPNVARLRNGGAKTDES